MQSVAVASPKQELPRRRRRVPLGLIIAGVVIAAAVAYLVFANTQANSVYYMTVPELHNCTACSGESVRVAGFVQSGSIVRHGPNIDFVISANGQTLPVTFGGTVPDIFHPGIEVVVEGHYPGQGTFQAQTLLAKCPSKFQSATPTP